MKNNAECAIKFNICKIDISILFVFIFYAVFNLLLFPTILAQNSTNIYDLYNKGAVQDSSGNYTQAIQFYDKALAINPNYINALTNKGVALDELGNHTGAINYYDQALAINPNDINAQTYKEIAINELDNQTLSVHY